MTRTSCPRCDRMPDVPAQGGRLFLWPPLGHTADKVRVLLRRDDLPCEDRAADGCLVIGVPDQGHAPLAARLASVLTAAEARDSRVLFVPGDTDPGLTQMGQVDRLETYLAREQGAWLLDLMRARRVTTLFQPIFRVDEPGRVFAHECLLRGLDPQGSPIAPTTMFDIARRADLVFQLDKLARTTAVATAAEKGVDTTIFINFTPSSIYDPVSCLRTTLAAVDDAALDRARVVFEVIETEDIQDPEHLAGVLAFYRRAGFRVALDDLGGGYATLGLLPSLRPDFVKLDRSLVHGMHADQVKAIVIERLVQLAHDLSIAVIAEGVEQAEDLDWLKRHDVDYVQGYLLARPAPGPWRP
ncbi:EAL domain-containing protein [Roseospira visakhapatnamensis]|uniref:EAL domain-containing protein (Putative c-di-GMP-specific phosphodiesterase class I) n=1 Tax=Roseospira visakhapatnamensis TaxID=390880 RepID=A0A7W6RBH9_9PROT|nr:EAL domain-containing protein [Roseospira visakhapatnamensis]MBB4265434.1 EAL domain-containing protein (putative c-di-GMP-specific phosphodiesterase class I) [Roseospira visakhapatnamensis]